jgi:hypothetical protein
MNALIEDVASTSNRIGNADYPGADETDYTYDAMGNRKTMVTGAGTASTPTTPPTA